MNNRQATFQLLNDIPVSKRFYSQNLRNVVVRKQARLQLHKKDTELLEPIITDILKMHGVI